MRDGIGSTSRDNLSGSRRVALTLFQHATLNLFELAQAHELGPRSVVKERWRQIDRHEVAELRRQRRRRARQHDARSLASRHGHGVDRVPRSPVVQSSRVHRHFSVRRLVVGRRGEDVQRERGALRPRQQHVAHVVPSDNLVVEEAVEAVGVVVADPALEEGAVVRRALTADVVRIEPVKFDGRDSEVVASKREVFHIKRHMVRPVFVEQKHLYEAVDSDRFVGNRIHSRICCCYRIATEPNVVQQAYNHRVVPFLQIDQSVVSNVAEQRVLQMGRLVLEGSRYDIESHYCRTKLGRDTGEQKNRFKRHSGREGLHRKKIQRLRFSSGQ